MNYVYIDSSSSSSSSSSSANPESIVIVGAATSSHTYQNILQNPNVAILIHDWTTGKSLDSAAAAVDVSSPSHGISSLSQFIFQMNQSALSHRSAALNGVAEIVSDSSANGNPAFGGNHASSSSVEFYKQQLLHANPEAECFIKQDNIAIIKVRILKAKVSDSANHISEYVYWFSSLKHTG